MDRIDLYRIFSRVVEARSFTRAADTLHLPRSSVSAAVAELEARLGVRLLHRTTRMVVPTREGEELYDRARSLISDAEDIAAMFRTGQREARGRLRVEVPGRIGRLILAPALPEFLAAWPQVSVDLGASDRAVDMIADRVDCALRVGELSDSGLRARRIGQLTQISVASPDYLARFGRPDSIVSLDRHQMVGYASPSTGRVAEWEWEEGGRSHSRPLPFRVTANSAETYIACARAGLGLIQIPAYDVAGDLDSGALVEVLPEARPAPMPMSLLFPRHERPPRRLVVFADWLEALIRRTTG